MKRFLLLCFTLILLVSVCSCQGNYSEMSLNDPISLPEDGVITEALLEKIKSENAIAIFTGESNGLSYEWKIFGSGIDDAHDIDLSLSLQALENGIGVIFEKEQTLDFPILLSITLHTKWTALGATAYSNGIAISSVSITNDQTTILHLPITGRIANCIILPDEQSTEEHSAGTNRPTSDGGTTEQDPYLTDSVPAGKPLPVEPENQEINKGKTYTCTFSIECSTILDNLSALVPDKLELVPANGILLAPTTVTFYEGESVFDVLQRVCKENNIHLEFSWTPIYNSAFIEGIHNLYEGDCGTLSGWMYRVDGWYPNYGCSRYQLADGEVVEWRYSCDLGNDIGREGSW